MSRQNAFTDGHPSYPRAIKEELGTEVEHKVISCLGNPIEQSHQGLKQRYYPILGFGDFESANASVKPMRRRINFSDPVSAWQNRHLYRISETTF